MECPSGRYLTEIVTPGGLTLDHPTEDRSGLLGGALDWSASEYKFADWNQLTVTLIGRLELSWLRFKSWPPLQSMAADEYNLYAEALNSIRRRYFEIRKPWVNSSSAGGSFGYTWGITLPEIGYDNTEEIGALVSICVDSQCLRQQLDQQLLASGADAPLPGETGHRPSTEGMSLLGTIALGAGAAAVIAGAVVVARKIGK